MSDAVEAPPLRGPRVPHPAPHGIPGLVRAQRLRTPDAVACTDPQRSLTYRELDALSDAAAAAVLRATGGRRGAVAVRMPRQADLLVGLLGVLKAGCHYVPVATDEPAPRLAAMLEVVRPLCALVAAGHEELAPPGLPAVTVPRTAAPGPDGGAPLRAAAPDDPVYALFTSGSTGTPKAVLLGSAALCNRIAWMAARFALDGDDRVLQKTPYTFDVAGWEFFLPLVTGARCVFAPVDAHLDARETGRVIAEQGVTVCHFVPTVLESWLRLADVGACTSLRHVVCSGEALPAALAARFAGRLDARLHNLYGPTEAGIDVTHWPVPRGLGERDTVWIGTPIDNVDLRVLDADGAPVPEGGTGELWIGGVQVALGYVGRPDLTARAFTEHDGVRWYRTGDLVRVEDGLVRCLGRTDDQVKIRGVRVEPGEVEAVLTAHPAVGAAAVVAVDPPGGGTELVAVAVRTAPGEDHEVLAHLAARLPRAFVPRALRWVERLPLTRSGKTDRRAVAAQTARWWAGAVGAAAPDGTDDGDPLARAWWRLLAVPPEQRRADRGFLALGGHSLTAAALLAHLAGEHRVELPLAALLRDDLSLDGLRARLAGTAPAADPPADPVAGAPDGPATPRDHSPLTPAQEPLWLLNRALADDSGNNVVGALHVPADLDPDTLRAALADVVARHDALRAAVRVTAGVPHWSYAPAAEAHPTVRRADRAPDGAAVTAFVGEIARRPVPLDRAPLMTVGLLHGDGRALVALSLHHLVADQHALEVVAGDLAAAYTARARGAAPDWPQPAPRFADFAHRRAATVGTPAWHADLAHWRELLDDAPARTPLPFRRTPPALARLDGRRTTAELGGGLSADIDALLARTGHTPAVYVLACVATVLAAWAGEERVAVGMPVSRRLRPSEVDLVGLVLSTVPLWITAGGGLDRDALLDHVRDRVLAAMEHATPTFQAIVHHLGLPPSPRDNPLFQVWVNDLSRIGPAPAFAGAPARWVDAAPPAALFDLNFYLRRGPDGYRLELVARTGLYEDEVTGELLRQVVAAAADLAAGRTPFAAATPVTGPAPAPAPAPELLPRLRRTAARRPAATAVAHPGGGLGYADLLAGAERVAAALAAAGVGPADVVELRATRTAELPAALLGGWLAGAAVAVTDAGLPPAVLDERQRLLRPRAVLTPGAPPRPADGPARRLPGTGHVLFTSGTSGRPAAVAVPPAALAATLDWYLARHRLGPDDRIAMLGGLGHDPLLRDVLAPLLAGGTVVVPPEDVFTAPDRLFALLAEERITVLHATPALLELILSGRPPGGARLADLRLVVSGGAPLTAGLVRAVRTATAATVVNAYGTTETPQLASQWQLDAGRELPADLPDAAVLPVGSGAGGAELLVLRPDGSPAPVGQVGEVVVRSPHLAAGYLADSGRGGRFDPAHGTYRSGDRGRRDPSGAVVLDGRLDRQLSVDGHRLDPEQVERAALRHPGAGQALLQSVDSAAGPLLTLAVVPVPGADAPTPGDLRSHLRALLPRWAVPTEIRVVAGLELDRRHKVVGARAADGPPAGGVPGGAAGNGAARNGAAGNGAAKDGAGPLLAELSRLVREIVGTDLPPAENFFDAGLNSMAVVRLHALLCERIAGDFPVTAMFEHPNLTALARFLAGGAHPAPPHGTLPGPAAPPGPAARPPQDPRELWELRRRIRRDLRGHA